MAEPVFDRPLMPEIARAYVRDRRRHDYIAREWVLPRAMPGVAAGTAARLQVEQGEQGRARRAERQWTSRR